MCHCVCVCSPQDLVSLLLRDVISGEVPEWFWEELTSVLLHDQSSLPSELLSDEEPSSKRRKVDTGPEKSLDGTVRYKILACETLYNLIRGNPHCYHWQQLLRKASKEEIVSVAKVLCAAWSRAHCIHFSQVACLHACLLSLFTGSALLFLMALLYCTVTGCMLCVV